MAAGQHDTFFPVVQINVLTAKRRIYFAAKIANLIIFMKLLAIFCSISVELLYLLQQVWLRRRVFVNYLCFTFDCLACV
jgi:hypothetical protein